MHAYAWGAPTPARAWLAALGDPMLSQSLVGLKILDLTRLLPGPFATQLLCSMGAQVDKLEDLEAGDYLRHIPPLDAQGRSLLFQALNRGKRSLALDLKSEAGRAVLERLLPSYDVLIEQFRPSVLARLGLSIERLSQAHPRMIFVSLSGYGKDGPLAERAGHDLNYMARSGALSMQEGCAVPGVQVADIGSALFAVIAIQSAWIERERTGKGSCIDLSMTECALPFALSSWAAWLGDQAPTDAEQAQGRVLTGELAAYGIYLSSDGQRMALAALEPKFWLRFCAIAGISPSLSDLAPGPHQAELRAKVTSAIASRSRAEWVDLGGGAKGAQADFCLEPVLSPAEARADEHLQKRGVWTSGLRLPIGGGLRPQGGAAPSQGEHGAQILDETGFSASETAAIIARGIIRG
jgi:alpha-methylacyl-CoA racemase